jgi:hypothetical protein
MKDSRKTVEPVSPTKLTNECLNAATEYEERFEQALLVHRLSHKFASNGDVVSSLALLAKVGCLVVSVIELAQAASHAKTVGLVSVSREPEYFAVL